MPTRPTSVTVICWILIVLSIVGLVGAAMVMLVPEGQAELARSPIPVPVQLAISFASLAIGIVCGVCMLSGQNWARLLYVGWTGLNFAFSLLTAPNKLTMIPGLIVFAIIAFFLFQPKANAFFTGKQTIPEGQEL